MSSQLKEVAWPETGDGALGRASGATVLTLSPCGQHGLLHASG
jgi:hypothetical protein